MNAVPWVQVVQAVDGGLPADWERILASWIGRKRTGALGCDPTCGSLQAPNPGAERSLG